MHKSQGSEFSKVFVVLPKSSTLLSRELLYTALTRAKQHLVLLIEGDNASGLYELTKPERSETARRNTNIFRGAVRERIETPYTEHLIHRADKGHMVRSKSELVIANMLFQLNIPYQYERPLERDTDHHVLRPDFSFADPSGEPILWEHLGMLSRDDYRIGWEWKRAWYEKNGFKLGMNLFTTEDDDRGGLDSGPIRKVAERIRELI